MKTAAHGVAWAAVSALAACGGGGSGGSDDGTSTAQSAVSVVLSPASITASFPGGGTAALDQPTANVTATVTNAPSGSVYAMVVDSGNVLQPGAHDVVANADGTYSANLTYERQIPVGTYTGTFTLKLCQDSACATPYRVVGGTLPYTVTVTPAATFTATVDGVAQPISSVHGREGDTLVVQASQPVDWSTAQGGAFASAVSTTTTTWTGTLHYGMSQSGETGDLEIAVAYRPDDNYSSTLNIAVTQ